MHTTEFLFGFMAVIVIGIVIGLFFNFFEGIKFNHSSVNVALGVAGAIIGGLLTLIIPMLPEYRLVALVPITVMTTIYFMFASWMLFEKTTPIINTHNSKGEKNVSYKK